MIPASVGFQCPDDVRRGAQEGRPARTALGGRIGLRAGRVTCGLIAANVAVYLIGLGAPDLAVRFGNLGLAVTSDGLAGVAQGQYYRLLTAAFLHAGLLHLASNMLALGTVGPALERETGGPRFLGLYLVCALGGSTLSFLVSSPQQLGVGASGAVFGLFGAYYVVARRLGRETGQIVAVLALNLVITFSVPIIDWRAHLGGLATGAALAAVLAYVPAGPRQRSVQAAGWMGVVALLVVAVAVRSAGLRI